MKFTSLSIGPDKSFACFIAFCFKSNGDYYFIDSSTLEASIQARDEQDASKPLRLIKPSISKETLGAHLDPNGSAKDQLEASMIKVRKHLRAFWMHYFPN